MKQSTALRMHRTDLPATNAQGQRTFSFRRPQPIHAVKYEKRFRHASEDDGEPVIRNYKVTALERGWTCACRNNCSYVPSSTS